MPRIVVDTNMMCTASPAGSADGQQAAEALVALRARARAQQDLRVAMSAALGAEWERQSPTNEGERREKFALRWLADLRSRRLVDDIEEGWPEEEALLAAASNNHRKPIRDDLHVIRLAMVTEQRILSFERKLPAYLCATLRRPGCPPALSGLHFAHPVDDDVAGWLGEGAPERTAMTLGGRLTAAAVSVRLPREAP